MNVKLEHQGSTTGYIYGFRIRTKWFTIINDGIAANGNAAATTFNPFNTDINTVRGQETGYPTWSPLVAPTSTFSDGNLTITTQASDYVNDLVTMRTPAGTGKWYWEFVQTARTGTDYTLVGMLPDDNTYKQVDRYSTELWWNWSVYWTKWRCICCFWSGNGR